MNPKGVATLNAQILKAVIQIVKISGTLILMSLLLLFSSCDKSDDFEPIRNESPIDYESPIDNESPSDNETPPVDEPPANNETPPDNDSPPNDDSNIVYTDIEPDFTSENLNDSYNLDLNNDQIFDFTVLSGNDNSWEWLFVGSNHSVENGIIVTTPWYNYVVPLNSDEVIYQNIFYELGGLFAIGECFVSEPGCGYDWKDKGDKYLGLRIIINGQKHYGWVRLDVTSVTQWVIKDYAYNATPNKPILAGQRN